MAGVRTGPPFARMDRRETVQTPPTLSLGGENMIQQDQVVPASARLQAQFGFTRIPNEIIEHPRLSMQAKMIWIELWKFCFHAEQGAFPGMARIAKDLGTSEDTILRHRRQLEEKGLLNVQRRGLTKTNLYILFVPETPQEIQEFSSYAGAVTDPAQSGDQEPASVRGQEPAPVRDKEDEVEEDESEKTNKPRSDKPTARKNVSFPKADYTLVTEAYKRIKGITPKNGEWQPIQQSIKTMFLSDRTPAEIIGCMEALEKSSEEWTSNWTIDTVRRKLPEFVAGKLFGGSGYDDARIQAVKADLSELDHYIEYKLEALLAKLSYIDDKTIEQEEQVSHLERLHTDALADRAKLVAQLGG